MKLVERIGVIGNGVVGSATARSWLEYAGEVRVYDTVDERRTHTIGETVDCDFVFMCLPTPANQDGSSNIDKVLDVCSVLRGSKTNLVLRSTVPPGTTRRLSEEWKLPNLIHNPEFLTARCAGMGAQLPSRNIIGNNGGASATPLLLRKLYQRRYPGIPCYMMTSESSELAKLVCNAFFATKISFFNEMRQISDAIQNVYWYDMLEAVLSDGRITHEHTLVPGPDSELGFGGSCLPKDLLSLLMVADQVLDEDSIMLRAVELKNEEVRNGR